MTTNLERIFLGKKALRHELANRPVTEKLRLLDALRARLLTIRLSLSPVPHGAPVAPKGSK